MAGVWAAGMEHGFGLHVREYREAIVEADEHLAEMHTAMVSRGEVCPHEDWLMLVTGTTLTPKPLRSSILDNNSESVVPDGFWLMTGDSVTQRELDWMPQPKDVVPTMLNHFSVAPRLEWNLSGKRVGTEARH